MDCDIIITPVASCVVEAVEMASVHIVSKNIYSDNSDVTTVTLDPDTQSSVPATDFTKSYCKGFSFLNFVKSQSKDCFQ